MKDSSENRSANIGARHVLLLVLFFLALGLTSWTVATTVAAPYQQTSPPSTATFTPTPVPTETPTFTPGTPSPVTPTPTRQPIRTEIRFPQSSSVVYGTFPIRGTAVVNNYQHYQLHISPSGLEEWSWLATSFEVVRDGDLAILDSSLYADGFYDLRLRSVRQDGNYREAYVRGFEIRNTDPPTATPTSSVTVTLEASPILPPLSPLGTPTATPEPTIDTTSFVPGGQGIYSPTHGDTLDSYERIIGTANGLFDRRFDRYELYLSQASQESWEWIFSSQNQFYDDVLYVLDTTEWPNGYYDLRLRIVYEDSNYDQYYVRNLKVQNNPAVVETERSVVRLDSPSAGDTVSGRIDLTGTAIDPNFQRWELYWRKSSLIGQEGQGWLFLFQGDYQVVNDLIARLDLSSVEQGIYDVRLRLVRLDGNYVDAFIRRLHVVPPTAVQ